MMRNTPAMLVLVSLLAIGIGHAEDDAKSTKQQTRSSSERSAKTIVYAARNSPANVLGDTITHFLEGTVGRVTVDPVSNVLLIDTTSDNQERVLAALQHLDRAPNTLRIQLHLLRARGKALAGLDTASLSGRTDEVLKSINALASKERVSIANRMELTAIESQPAMLQVGESVAMVTGSSNIPGRGSSSNYRNLDVGTLFKVQTRVSGESEIVMEVDFDKSEVAPRDIDSDGEPRRVPQGVSRLTHQTTSRIRDGHSLLVATFVSQSLDGVGEAYLVLSASIDGKSDSKQGTAFRSFSDKRPMPASAGATKTAADSNPVNPRFRAYYVKLLAKYDLNQDEKLNADERSKMARDCSAADTDKDGLVSVDELTVWSMKR